LYHLPSEAARDEKNHFKQRLFWEYLVLYHRPGRDFPPGPPLLDVGVPAAEVAGVAFGPAVLRQELACFPTGVPTTGFLTFSNPRIRPEKSAAKMASLEHLGPPQHKQWRPL
jgi:hypothetical protein